MAAGGPGRTFDGLLFYRLKEGTMKLITTTAVLAACLFGPASALAVPADSQHQPLPRSGVIVTDLRSPDAQQPVTPVHQSPNPVSSTPSSSDFDWTDAALGAGSMLAFALLVGGAFVLVGTNRSRHGSPA